MKSKRIPKQSRRPAVAAQAGKPATQSPFARPVVLAVAALCALVAIAYSNSIGNGFVWDDHEQIVMNPYIKPGAPLAPLFAADVRFARQDQSESTQVYRPLQLLTYRAVDEWFGGSPEAFHVCSVAFAVCGTLAVFAVFWLLTRRGGVAFAATALFAVYPIHTEAVDWIAALPDLGFGLFSLLAFALFIAPKDRQRRWPLLALSLLAFAISLLWKETAAVFPVVIATYVLLVEPNPGNRWRRAAVESAPYWMVLAVYLAVRLAVLGKLSAGSRDWALTPLQSVLTMVHLMVSYWMKLALPLSLNAYYVFHPIRSLADARGWIAMAFAVAAIVGIVALLRRAPLAAFAALWVCIFLIPAMNFGGLGRNPFAERYLYLPSAGFCLLVVLAAAWLIGRLKPGLRTAVGGGLLAVWLAVSVAETSVRNMVWRDDETLFSQTLMRSPDAPFVRLMVAANQGADPGKAEENYRNTIALAQQQTPPDRFYTVKGYEGLASLYGDRGQIDQALEMLSRARALAPDDADVAGEEGMILTRAGNGSAGEAALDRALAAHPNNENVLSALGLIAREEHHDLKRAAELFSHALAVHPQEDDFNASLHNNLAAVYADQENYPAAIAEIRQAIRILPQDPEFHVNLAGALAATGHFDEARGEAEAALRIAPNDPNAREVLERLSATH